MSLKVANKVPDFTLIADNGKPFKLSSKVKNKALLVFYPGDGTPVCTNQFIDYSKNEQKFNDLGVEIIGISANEVSSHQAFKKAHAIPFTLLADAESKVAKEYDCFGWFGTKRGVFLIDNELKLKYSHIESVSIFKRTARELIESIKKHS
jgi:peroxiredoxin Q/BCP